MTSQQYLYNNDEKKNPLTLLMAVLFNKKGFVNCFIIICYTKKWISKCMAVEWSSIVIIWEKEEEEKRSYPDDVVNISFTKLSIK
jgi:hypothetical protein